MRQSRLAAFLAVSCVLLAGAPARAQDEKAAVLAVVKQLFDGMRARDADMIRRAVHPSAQLISSSIKDGVPQISVTPIDAFVTGVTRPGPSTNDERTRNEVVQIDGGLATVWADYAFYRGTEFHHCGIDAFQLAKSADGWKIVALGDTRRTDGCDWPK